MGLGDKTRDEYLNVLSDAKIIFWDGESGYYDNTASLKPNPIFDFLVNADSSVAVITDYEQFSKNLIPCNEKLQISYNIDCAYTYLKGESLEALEMLKS